MAQVTITIPDAQVGRINDAFAQEFEWSTETGLTKAQFTRQQIIKFIKRIVKTSEGNVQAMQARLTVENEVENINIS